MKVRSILLAIVFVAAGAKGWAESHDSCNSRGLSATAPGTFIANEPLAPALLELGQISHVCFGLRLLDDNAFTHILHVNMTNASVRQILDSMVRELPDYVFREFPPSVVLVGKLDMKAPDLLLDKVVPSFDSPRAPLHAVSNALKMQIAVNIDPTITGFAGSYPTGDIGDQVGPIQENGKMIWELLNEIVGDSGGRMWISSLPESGKTYPRLNLWKVIEYSMPPKEAEAAIQRVASQFQNSEASRH